MIDCSAHLRLAVCVLDVVLRALVGLARHRARLQLGFRARHRVFGLALRDLGVVHLHVHLAQRRLRALEARLAVLDGGLQLRRIDLDQDLALRHHVAFAHRQLHHLAGRLVADLDLRRGCTLPLADTVDSRSRIWIFSEFTSRRTSASDRCWPRPARRARQRPPSADENLLITSHSPT